MSVSSVTFAPPAMADRGATHDPRTAENAASSFAGMLAGAVHAHVPKPHPKPPKDGTSELDASDDATNSDDASGATTSADDASASSAGTTAAAATPTDAGTNGVVRSIAALDPELQARLARVIDRVRAETGHEVTVEETYRSQSRQDRLFAQGRDAAGPVVTWTQSSKHTQGRAVDLLLDGGKAGSDAYAAMQRIAGEEGLRTLGAKDPGHIELPGSTARDMKAPTPAAPADATGPGDVPVARVAQVARVADVKVAAPAPVARVATAGQAAHVSGVSAGGAQSSRRDAGDGRGQGDQRGGYGSLAAPALTSLDVSPAAAVQAPVGPSGAERVAKVMAAMEDAPARPLSQITMSVDAGNGAVDRVHVALRGSALSSTIDAADLHAAQTMSAKSDELVRALTRDGLEVESLRVRAVASGAAPAIVQTAQSSSGSSTGSRFERGHAWEQSERQQQSQDNRRQQQRDQRRGQSS